MAFLPIADIRLNLRPFPRDPSFHAAAVAEDDSGVKVAVVVVVVTVAMVVAFVVEVVMVVTVLKVVIAVTMVV